MISAISFWFAIVGMIFLSEGVSLCAQNSTIDSREKELHSIGYSDSARLTLFLQLAYRINNSNPTRAEEYARSAIDLSKKLNALRELARSYRYLGTSLQMRAFYLQALVYYDSSRAIAESIGDSEAISAVWTNIGLLCESQGDYPRALEYALRSLRIDVEMKNKDYIANSLLNIGALYAHQKEDSTALQYYHRSKTLAETVNNHETLIEIYYGIGRVYKDRKSFDRALRYFDTALAKARKYENDRLKADVLYDIGSLYLMKGEPASAREYLHEALRIQQQRQDKTAVAGTLAALGIFYLLSNNLPKAEEYFTASLRIADELGVKETQMNVCRHLGELYKRQGQLRKALKYKERELAYRDTLFNTERSKKIGRLEMHYQLEQKNIENQLLMRDRELQAANQSRSQLLLVALSVVLLLSVGIAFVFWRSRNAQRRVNTELERHQTIIEEQARKIENANIELQERNTLLIDANEELQNTYSQIHQQTKSLQEKNLALEQLNNEKNDLVAIVAHDLKNPIAAIRGLSELTHQQIDEGAQIKEIIAQISRTADRMLELVKNILDMNRLESGTVQINVVAFDIEPLTKGIVSTFTEQAAAKSITLNFHSKEANIIVQADEQATMQILENLISNAVKYSPHGKNIFVRVQSQKNTVRVEVQDEGPGISEEDMKKLFGKFARLSARPTGGEHSTGLGLSIVKKMVEAMNGRVWCESELGKGATFIVELPRA